MPVGLVSKAWDELRSTHIELYSVVNELAILGRTQQEEQFLKEKNAIGCCVEGSAFKKT